MPDPEFVDHSSLPPREGGVTGGPPLHLLLASELCCPLLVSQAPSAGRAYSDADLARRLADGDGDAHEPSCSGGWRRACLYGLRHLRTRAGRGRRPGQDVMLVTFDGLREGRVREPEQLASYVLGTCRKVVAGFAVAARRAAWRQKLLDRASGLGAGSPRRRLAPCWTSATGSPAA